MFGEIKKGFFVGLGLIVPLLLVEFLSIQYAATEMTAAFSDSVEGLEDNDSHGAEQFYQNYNASYVDAISLSPTTHRLQGNQLLIAGSFTNNSDKTINNLEIEAELYDEQGSFVYECTKSLYEPKDPGVTENYLITCGCSKNGLPAFKSIDVKVVRASVF